MYYTLDKNKDNELNLQLLPLLRGIKIKTVYYLYFSMFTQILLDVSQCK